MEKILFFLNIFQIYIWYTEVINCDQIEFDTDHDYDHCSSGRLDESIQTYPCTYLFVISIWKANERITTTSIKWWLKKHNISFSWKNFHICKLIFSSYIPYVGGIRQWRSHLMLRGVNWYPFVIKLHCLARLKFISIYILYVYFPYFFILWHSLIKFIVLSRYAWP